MGSLKERLLRTVFRMGRYYAWWVLLAMLLIAGFGVYYARTIPLRSAFLDLLPTNDPLIEDYKRNEQYYAESDYVAVLLTLTSDVPMDEREGKLIHAAEIIAGHLEDDPEFRKVTYLQEVSPAIPDQYLYLFQLGQEELAQIETSVGLAQAAVIGTGELRLVSQESLGSVYKEIGDGFGEAIYRGELSVASGGDVEALQQQLQSIEALNMAVLQVVDRLDELPPITQAVESLTDVFAPVVDPEARKPRPYLSSDRTSLIMALQPRLSSQQGVEYSELVTDKINEAIAASDPSALGVRVGVAGNYSYNAQTNAVINADMLRTTIISSVGVFVIFLLAFGSVFYSIIGLIPLLISVVLTMCWAKFAVGGFNLVTTFLPALVLGLGIDYAIHIISRYSEERSKGRSLNRALYTSVLHKGEASFVAAATTALVFVGLLSARSRALFEMGVISSVGVMVAFAVTLILLPALITIAHFVFRVRHREQVANYSARLTSFFRLVTEKGRAIFVIVLILTFFVAFQAAQTSFVFSSNDLVPHVETIDVLNEIEAKFQVSPTSLGSYFTFYAASEEEMRDIVSRLQENELVETVDSAVGLLPVNLTEQQQVLNQLDIETYLNQLEVLETSLQERAAIVTQIRTLLTQFTLIQYGASFNGYVGVALSSNEILEQLRRIQEVLLSLNVDTALDNVEGLRGALGALNTELSGLRDLPPIETLLRDILGAYPEAIRSRYLTRDGNFVVKARVSNLVYDGANLDAFTQFAASLSDTFFGMPVVAKQLEDYMKRDFSLSTAIAAILILLVLWRSLRGWMRALLAAAPLVLGYIWMLGGMRLLSIDFNFLSITISPLLIGIGVDNGIHILHRTMEERLVRPEGAIERGVGETAIAVIVTSFTTMLVFGSLLIARTPGLRMLGISALLGIGFSLVFSLLFLPAALRVEGGKRV